jgi:molecular chaperone HtpG
LFDQAVLTLGARIEEPAAFVGRLNDLLVSLSAESPSAESPDAGSPDTGPVDAGDRGTAPTTGQSPDPEP